MFVTPDGIVTFEVKVYNPEGDPFINITTESDTLQYKQEPSSWVANES